MQVRHVVVLLCLLFAVLITVPVVFVAALTITQPRLPYASPTRAGVATALVPPLARQMLPLLDTLVGRRCPELSVPRVLAEVQAESGWDPQAWSDDANGGAAGLLQINQANWVALGGEPWPSTPPPSGSDVYDPSVQLTLGVNFLCGNLRAMTRHLQRSGKALDPMDAMSVCHIAGCGRVVQSRTGIPEAGEAGCDQRCATLVRRYLDNIHRYERTWSSTPANPGPTGDVPDGIDLGDLAAPASFPGGPPGCIAADPTNGSGCLSAATAYAFGKLQEAFGPEIRSAGCWARRPWNPTSDHPAGRACDLFPDRAGIFPSGKQKAAGWRMAAWLRMNAAELRVKYVIWQGRYWDPSTGDQGGWGARYNGGGVYNPNDATGGHFDHVHVSFRE